MPPPLGRDGAERAGPRHRSARHEVAGCRVDLVSSGHGSECAESVIGRWVARREIAVAKPGDKADAPAAAGQGMNAKSIAARDADVTCGCTHASVPLRSLVRHIYPRHHASLSRVQRPSERRASLSRSMSDSLPRAACASASARFAASSAADALGHLGCGVMPIGGFLGYGQVRLQRGDLLAECRHLSGCDVAPVRSRASCSPSMVSARCNTSTGVDLGAGDNQRVVASVIRRHVARAVYRLEPIGRHQHAGQAVIAGLASPASN